MAIKLTDSERFNRKVFAALPRKGKSAAMKEIAEGVGLLTSEGDRTFVSSVNGTKLRKALHAMRDAKKVLITGNRSTTRYAKA